MLSTSCKFTTQLTKLGIDVEREASDAYSTNVEFNYSNLVITDSGLFIYPELLQIL